MISPEGFLNKWNSDTYGLVNYEESVINLFSLDNQTKDFLIKAGLPESAPPFLTFETSTNGGAIRLAEKNNSLGELYDRFIYLGYTGSGNPVCINECNSQIVYIDYDNENKIVLINSSIARLVESLPIYVEFVKKIKAENGKRAYIQKNATKELLDWLSMSLYQIDTVSLIQDSYWEEELISFSQ